MRLVLVHGRAQGERSEQLLRDEWLPALHAGVKQAGEAAITDEVDVRLPFYGAELDRLVDTPLDGTVVRRGAGTDVPDPFEAELLLGIAHRAGVTDAEIAAEMGVTVVARGPQNWEWLQAAGRLLSRRAPWLGDGVMARFLRDVDAYLTRVDVAKAVDELVRPHVDGDRAVVVGHSLGSVVAYNVLTQLGDHADVPLFVTVGSPLGIPVVKRYLPRPLGMPRGVRHWINGADERDPVALYARLGGDTFPADIENVSDVSNDREHPHGIAGYLAHAAIARSVARALAT